MSLSRKKNPRKTYTTSLNFELTEEFRFFCVYYGLQQNDVLEELISGLLEEKGQKTKEIIEERRRVNELQQNSNGSNQSGNE